MKRVTTIVLLLTLLAAAACGDETSRGTASPVSSEVGEVRLLGPLTSDATTIRVANADPLLHPSLGADRWLKIESEWMQYCVRDVHWEKNEVSVRRGRRGSIAQAHPPGTRCHALASPLPESSK